MTLQEMFILGPNTGSKKERRFWWFKGFLDLILVTAVVGIFALSFRKGIQDHTDSPQTGTPQSGCISPQVAEPQTVSPQSTSTPDPLQQSSLSTPTKTSPVQTTARKTVLNQTTLKYTKLPENIPQQEATRQSLQSSLNDEDIKLNLHIENDDFIQECGKESFRDVDYSLFGYDILKGFPLAEGLDPGFTLPIFKADYSTGEKSADCRYSIPKGLIIVPDVSCVTSFTSETITTHREYSESLGVMFGVETSLFGASFSTSVEYRKTSSAIESNEKVYILTTARCNYYKSKLLLINPPPFDKVFLQWIKSLERTADKDVYMKFLDTYGTHVPVEMLFGARYTFKHSMTRNEFESKKRTDLNIEMSASYSALLSVGLNFKLDKHQEEMAQQFRENVTTKTVTVGAAPPADGDALKWASSVQSNPVPVYYKLTSIENLFSADLMEGLGVDYDRICSNLTAYKRDYEDYLRKKEFLSGCLGVDGQYVKLEKTSLRDNGPYQEKGTLPDCLSVCENDPTCIGFSMTDNSCDFADGEGPNKSLYAYSFDLTTSYILWQKTINNTIRLQQTFINGIIFRRDQRISTVSKCEELCSEIERCFAMSFRDSCRLFEKRKVFSFAEDARSTTTIFSKCP